MMKGKMAKQAGKQITSNKDNVRLELDMVPIFEKAYTGKSDEFRDILRQRLSDPDVKSAFGNAVVDEIIDRTHDRSKDRNNAGFKAYKKSYTDSLIYKLYKGGSRKVNLTLTGEMLSKLVSKEKSGKGVVIKFKDSKNSRKAHGHITAGGTLAGRQRDFLGITQDRAAKIMKDVLNDFAKTAETEIVSRGIEDAFEPLVVSPGQELLFDIDLLAEEI